MGIEVIMGDPSAHMRPSGSPVGATGQKGAQGPIGPPGPAYNPFRADADGHTLYVTLVPYQGYNNVFREHLRVLMEVGRVAERLGIREADMQVSIAAEYPVTWMAVRFENPDDALAFRTAVSLPFQASV